jgi:hypothetical protein
MNLVKTHVRKDWSNIFLPSELHHEAFQSFEWMMSITILSTLA